MSWGFTLRGKKEAVIAKLAEQKSYPDTPESMLQINEAKQFIDQQLSHYPEATAVEVEASGHHSFKTDAPNTFTEANLNIKIQKMYGFVD